MLENIVKQIGLPIETVTKAVDFIGELVGPTLKELSLIPFDAVREFRYKRQVQILMKTKQFCIDNGIKPKEIGLKNLVSLLEVASLEEDDDMFELWTNLLINSATNEVNDNIFLSSYINILKQLSPIEAKILNYINENQRIDINLKKTYDLLQLEYKKDENILKIAFNNLSRMELVFDEGEAMHIGYLENKFRDIASSCDKISMMSGYYNDYGDFNRDEGAEIADILRKNLKEIEFDNYTGIYRCTFLGYSFIKACNNKKQ